MSALNRLYNIVEPVRGRPIIIIGEQIGNDVIVGFDFKQAITFCLNVDYMVPSIQEWVKFVFFCHVYTESMEFARQISAFDLSKSRFDIKI